MLTYFIFGQNNYTIRVAQTTSTAVTMSIQDMTRLTNITASLTGVTYNSCESMLSFTASINTAIVGEEYRATITNGVDTIYNGSVQVFTSQSINKPVYKTQNDEFISHPSDNEYIIIDRIPTTTSTSTTTSTTSTTSTTTLPPTTTTTSTTSTTSTSTTTLPPTTTTTSTTSTTSTTTAAPPSATLVFGRQVGGMGFDVCVSGSTDGNISSVNILGYNLFMSSDSGCTIPYGTQWSMTSLPQPYTFTGATQKACSSGGNIDGSYYRTRVSGSLTIVTQPGSVVSSTLPFDISGSGFQDVSAAGRTLRIFAAGCTLNNNASGCP